MVMPARPAGASPWQRFWRSPWTYLGLMAWMGWAITSDHGWWVILDVVLFFYWGVRFFQMADKKWGKP